ncbi:3-hydroxyacyl-CoA dehydrogenase NAD-binding domain-containing protein [Dehalococcoidia bacterium]|nr:3-hydroxyacyl-CoA dehydrogenase NAD-binding domain-containing protein [Dehalococcoidia bacterium]MCL0073940.1 3-hydroxyacyl-CoA dehydrogenase NAD-binding domain-containing protein [Dehalococcoidia bacterium]
MKRKIRTAAVLGAGVMGSTIAAHLANAGIPTYLLDIVPGELTEEDKKRGLTPESPAFRSKLARKGLENALKASPAAFYVPEDAKLVTPGNFEDHMQLISDVDWIIEVVIENLEIKKALLKKVEQFRSPGTIVTTNTSGISIDKMSEELSQEFKEHFLGTHFFNPPRYMKLLEIIPGKSTRKEIVDFMASFCEKQLGKGIVFAKDTPNFIANRIGIHDMLGDIRTMVEDGYTIEEVDAITGTPMGRPKTATFRTADLVGLDTLVHVARNVYDNVGERERNEFVTPEIITRMVDMGLLGDKTGKGFYRKVKTDKGSEIHALDYKTMDYAPLKRAAFPVLDGLKKVENPAERIKTLVYSEDRAGRFAWKAVKRLLLYCADKIPEIADDILSVDRAMKWGFNWELGPFETWDAIGVTESVRRMEAEGEEIPDNIKQMLSLGRERFYERRDGRLYFFDFQKSDYLEIEDKPQIIILPSLKERKRLIKSNAGASLVDLGDGVACLEFHSPNNAIGADIIQMLNYSIKEVEENFEGLVIGNHGRNFSVGANLMLLLFESQNQNWDAIQLVVKQFQDACSRIKYAEKPVVAAPSGMTLGGGCEICMAANRIRASAETYIGLVEVGVGLIPAGGGNKELLLANMEWVPPVVPSAASPQGSPPDLLPYVAKTFDTIARAKVSTSGRDARNLGFLRPQDKVTVNLDHLLYDAKETVLAMAREGYSPVRPRDDIRVTGRTGRASLELIIYTMREGGFITDYDGHIARKLAYVLTGGDVAPNTLVTEEYLLELEREAFVSLCGEKRTQDRMRHMLQTNKPLRN